MEGERPESAVELKGYGKRGGSKEKKERRKKKDVGIFGG